MTVAFDAVGPSSSGTSALSPATTLSWTHTAVAGNVALAVWVGMGSGADSGRSFGVTCDGSTMSSLGIAHSNASTTGFGQFFGLPNLSSGAHSIVATVTGGAPTSIEGGSVSYTGADLTSPFGTAQTHTGASGNPTITFTGSTTGNMVIAGVVNGSGVTSESAGTQRWLKDVNNSTGAGNAAEGDIAAGGSVTLTWSTATDIWAVVALEVFSGVSSSGPNYAGAASDLGGGAGSWANTGNADGSPDSAYATWTAP